MHKDWAEPSKSQGQPQLASKKEMRTSDYSFMEQNRRNLELDSPQEPPDKNLGRLLVLTSWDPEQRN